MSKPRPKPTVEQLHQLMAIEEHPASEVIGIDEVGFGAWAGPLVVGGVVLTKGWDHELCRDSKALTANRRQKALPILAANWISAVVVGMEAPDVDQVGVGVAREQLTALVGQVLSERHPQAVLVQDGDVPVPIQGRDNTNMVWMPGADGQVPAVSAASILAKVTRDTDMVYYSEVFPDYDFQSNKGYRSPKHELGLATAGPSPIHRFSYKPVRQRVVPSQPWQSRHRKQGMDVWMSFPAQ